MESIKNIDVTAHMDDLDEYIEVKKLAESVLSNFSNIDTVNMNDVYDIIYVNEFAKSVIDSEIKNDGVKSAMEDLYERTHLIIKLLNENILSTARKNSEKLSKKDKAKVDNVDKSKFVGKSTESVDNLSKPKVEAVKKDNPIKQYLLKKGLAKIIVLIVLFIALGYVSNPREDTAETSETVAESTESTENTQRLGLLESPQKWLRTASGLVIMLASVGTCISLCCDFMYIALPFARTPSQLREKNKNDSSLQQGIYDGSLYGLASEEARDVVRELEAPPTYETKFSASSKYNRIERAENIYSNFVTTKEMFKNGDTDEAQLYDYILTIIKDHSTYKKESIDYIKNIAKAEILYNNNADVCSLVFDTKKEQIVNSK